MTTDIPHARGFELMFPLRDGQPTAQILLLDDSGRPFAQLCMTRETCLELACNLSWALDPRSRGVMH